MMNWARVGLSNVSYSRLDEVKLRRLPMPETLRIKALVEASQSRGPTDHC